MYSVKNTPNTRHFMIILVKHCYENPTKMSMASSEDSDKSAPYFTTIDLTIIVNSKIIIIALNTG